jgi:glycosyltransferase involved in cell wall biosynthesis
MDGASEVLQKTAMSSVIAGQELACPLVSVGVPVYNSARYLRSALDSVLNQTLTSFELIISDNASTDDTRAICEEYVRRDARVRYIRQARNIGAPRNWNVLVHEARGEFFKWASGNDNCAPTLLERCVDAMRREPTAVLCYGRTQLIDENAEAIGVYEKDIDVSDARASDRFERVRRELSMNNAQQGVIRSAVLRRTGLDRPYPNGDIALMAELALYGRFLLLPDVLLYRRQSPGTITAMRSPADLQRIFNPEARAPMKLVLARFHWDHFVGVARAPIPLRERLRAWGHSVRHARWDRSKLWSEVCSLVRSEATTRARDA